MDRTASSSEHREEKLSEERRCAPISVCRLYAEDAGEAVSICEALLQEPDLEPAVRVGDLFGFLVEHHCQHGNFQVVRRGFGTKHLEACPEGLSSPVCFVSAPLQAYRRLEELQKLLPSQNVRYYVSQASLEALERETGLPAAPRERRHSVREDDEVEEDLNGS